MQMETGYQRTTLRIFGLDRGERWSSLLGAVVLAAAIVVLFTSPGKVTLQFGTPGSEGATLFTSGFAPWGVRAALAGLVAFAGIGLATYISARPAGGWPAAGLIVSAAAFGWIADYSRDYHRMWEARERFATEFEVVTLGPAGWVAFVAAAGAIASIASAVWTVLRGRST